MACLGSVHYDPAVAVTKATTASAAMVAFDTTNARITFTVPASGRVFLRIQCAVHGATTAPALLFGVLETATVRGRTQVHYDPFNLAATSIAAAEGCAVVSGLTPAASLTWDAAFGIETGVASTGLKYGGGNNATANDAFGGLSFEVWSA